MHNLKLEAGPRQFALQHLPAAGTGAAHSTVEGRGMLLSACCACTFHSVHATSFASQRGIMQAVHHCTRLSSKQHPCRKTVKLHVLLVCCTAPLASQFASCTRAQITLLLFLLSVLGYCDHIVQQ